LGVLLHKFLVALVADGSTERTEVLALPRITGHSEAIHLDEDELSEHLDAD